MGQAVSIWLSRFLLGLDRNGDRNNDWFRGFAKRFENLLDPLVEAVQLLQDLILAAAKLVDDVGNSDRCAHKKKPIRGALLDRRKIGLRQVVLHAETAVVMLAG
ncbi:hypothetical protein DTL42_19820 [Bremerella cremea]|uniref:Uncharacterized protein n=1 Tax=Bremerella cremea TaxID=1031537 RepID=A0A368KLM5_9BACT|nr:hypothetical protein DTL42_19820 [Bremerella cremea]